MLFVAITGPVGSEKTSTLREFAETIRGQGYSVEGFVSIAGPRRDFTKSAESYTWQWMKTGQSQLFARQDEEGKFQLQSEALDSLEAWAKTLSSKQDLIVLDEFGKWEAEGDGLMPYWPYIEAAKPRMLVATLREGCQAAIEERLGRKFNRVLDVEAHGVQAELKTMFAELKDWELVGTYGATSGGIECSLGSWLHATRFPMTGTVMGSLQAAMLAVASRGLGRKELVVWISTISAGLKTFSPTGTRIGPMIAIAMQGLVFMIGAMIGRWTKFGFAIGAFLVGLLAALQGFLIQYLMLGRSLEMAYSGGARYLVQRLGLSLPSMWVAIVLLCFVNGLISVGLTLGVLARTKDTELLAERFEKTTSGKRKLLFWFPLALVIVIFFLSDVPASRILWTILQVVTVSAALVGLGKLIVRVDITRMLTKRGKWGPAYAVQIAQERASEGRHIE